MLVTRGFCILVVFVRIIGSFGEPGEPSNPRVLGSVVIQVSQGSVLALGFGNKLWGCFGST